MDLPLLYSKLLLRCGILRTLSHHIYRGRPRIVLGHLLWDPPDIKSPYIYRGRPRTVLGHLLWDPPDIKSPYISRTSQDCSGTSVVGSSEH